LFITFSYPKKLTWLKIRQRDKHANLPSHNINYLSKDFYSREPLGRVELNYEKILGLHIEIHKYSYKFLKIIYGIYSYIYIYIYNIYSLTFRLSFWGLGTLIIIVIVRKSAFKSSSLWWLKDVISGHKMTTKCLYNGDTMIPRQL
jgi:hypothetical protein